MVLDHLHVHQRSADAVGERDPVAGHDQAVGGRLVGLAGAAAGEDHVLGGEGFHVPAADLARDHPAAAPLVVEHQRGREPLLVALDGLVVLHQLLVEDVQQRLSGDVGDVGGPLQGRPPEGTQVEFALVVAVEGDADVLEVHDLGRGFRAHDFDRVLVAQEVRALDGVVGVRAPVVVDADGRVDATGGGHRVRAHRMDLAHDGHTGPALGGGEGGPLAGQARADDQHIVRGHRPRSLQWSFQAIAAESLLRAVCPAAAPRCAAVRRPDGPDAAPGGRGRA